MNKNKNIKNNIYKKEIHKLMEIKQHIIEW